MEKQRMFQLYFLEFNYNFASSLLPQPFLPLAPPSAQSENKY